MSKLPCRVSIDERNHDLKQFGADEFNDSVDAEAMELAQALIEDGAQLMELVIGHDIDIFSQLARCMREFEEASIGNPIARDTCLNALSLIEKIVKVNALEIVRGQAISNVEKRK